MSSIQRVESRSHAGSPAPSCDGVAVVTAHEREPSFKWMSVSRSPRSLFQEFKRTRDPELRTRLVEGLFTASERESTGCLVVCLAP